MSYSLDQPPVPAEDVNRGTVVALLTIPAGVIAWCVVWSIGFIASIITFGIAVLALFLYRLGSGGTIGRAGAVRVTIITLATLALAIVAGLITSVALSVSRFAKVSPIEALTHPNFGEFFSNYMRDGGGQLGFSLLIAVAFGILGCFSVLRGAFRQAAPVQFQAPEAQAAWPTLPANPAADPFADERPTGQNPVEEKPADPTEPTPR